DPKRRRRDPRARAGCRAGRARCRGGRAPERRRPRAQHDSARQPGDRRRGCREGRGEPGADRRAL
ncbi:MAG: hypothetical protein AVDCRST_MAG45-2627, partial [uncultured Solirubrobacterales bacterium]